MAARGSNQFRIIAGEWKGRRLRFAPVEGLRPTTDRTRETLFNWLQGRIEGARCLDLFAGSGALSFEALSRGAAGAVAVDRSTPVVRALRENAETLKAGNRFRAVQSDALAFLRGRAEPADVVFLDPPFRSAIIGDCCHLLEQHGWLAPDARIYVEAPVNRGEEPLPVGWKVLRGRTAGQVDYRLAAAASAENPETAE